MILNYLHDLSLLQMHTGNWQYVTLFGRESNLISMHISMRTIQRRERIHVLIYYTNLSFVAIVFSSYQLHTTFIPRSRR